MSYDIQNASHALLFSVENLGANHPATLAIKKRLHDLRAAANTPAGERVASRERAEKLNFAAAFRAALSS